MMRTGQIVTIARKELKLTQAELAKRADITRNSVSRIENGDYANMTAYTAVKLARALGISLDVLLCLEQ